MTRPAPPISRLARRLLELEEDAGSGRGAVVEAAERAADKVGRHLSRLVGAGGYHALLRRALILTTREYPFLSPVQPSTGGGALDGLEAAVQDIEHAEARVALAEMFAQLLRLLVTFIGQDLTFRTLRQVWPELAPDLSNPDAEETST